jgi:CHAD domain-containing protein
LTGAVKQAQRRSSPKAAPPMDVAAGAHETLEQAAKALAENLRGVLSGESEAIHQFRISLRRLRALLELYQSLLSQNWFTSVREELRFFGDSVGVLRDIDVLQQKVSDAAVKLDQSLRAALIPLHKTLALRRQQQHDETSALLRSPRCEALMHSLRSAAFKQMPGPDAPLRLAPLIQPFVRKVERVGAKLSRDSDPVEFHRLRVRIKRLRYAVEMVDANQSKQAKRAMKKLKSAQEVLGMQHDLVTAIGWLKEVAASSSVPGPALLAAGAVYEVLQRQSLKVSRRAWKKWKEVRSVAIDKDIVTGFPDGAASGNNALKVEAA